MSHILGLSLLAAATLWADTPASETAKQLYENGLRLTREGKLDAARLTLQALVDAYPHDPLVLPARGAMDAAVLFAEGQARTHAGKYETARVAFETLLVVYPESPLVARTRLALAALGHKEKRRRVVKAMEFRDVSVPAAEIRAEMDAREVRLTEGRPYDSRDIEQAKSVLEEILEEKGMAKPRIQTQTRTVEPDAVDVIFTVERPHGSLFGSPFRLAASGWRHVKPGGGAQEPRI